MFRLATENNERLGQSSTLCCSFAGSEANVAVNLSIWGEYVKFLSILPKNEIGFKCLNDLRKYGVKTENIIYRNGRMGLMFLEFGAGLEEVK